MQTRPLSTHTHTTHTHTHTHTHTLALSHSLSHTHLTSPPPPSSFALQVGCNWVEVPAGKYTLRTKGSSPAPVSLAQYEIDVAYDSFISHPAEDEWQKVGEKGMRD